MSFFRPVSFKNHSGEICVLSQLFYVLLFCIWLSSFWCPPCGRAGSPKPFIFVCVVIWRLTFCLPWQGLQRRWSSHAYRWAMSHIPLSHFMHLKYVTHIAESCCAFQRVMAHIPMSHGTHINESWHTYHSCTTRMYSRRVKDIMGWLRVVGSFKL